MDECPVPYGERTGVSKMRVLADGILILTTYVGTAIRYRPLRVLGTAGGILLAAAFVGAVVAPSAGPVALGLAVLGGTLAVAGAFARRRAARLCAAL